MTSLLPKPDKEKTDENSTRCLTHGQENPSMQPNTKFIKFLET